MQLILIHPGSTDFDRQGRIQGNLDIPLSDQGRQQVERSIEPLRKLNMQALYTASCEPATETAEMLSEALDLKLKAVEGLNNLDHGLWQGMLVDEVKTKQPRVYRQWQENPESICPPGGEMLSDVRERVQKSLGKLIRKHREGIVGLVAPEPLASIVRNMLQGESLEDLWKPCSGGTWESIDVSPQATLNGR